ncbi:TRAP transporter small permease subunit [Futiania mangrovi]|uniref:TRAP transporter small permease protein n=1 Tax=Futiania mangrovi TaxID=2959716 RepID=A0A9J6P9G1_9PROT|nr:TRAP transporter small permease [Futiania mangrovii]MCP1335493.1 TRAP transporter small permease [Futiania mangrovii]
MTDDASEPGGPRGTGRLARAAAALSDVFGALAGVALAGIVVIVCTEIVLRLFRHSLLVTDEMGAYLNAAVVFLGLAYSLRHGAFIRMEFVYDRLSRPVRRLATWCFVLITTVFVAALVYVAWKHVQYAYVQDTRAISVLATPEWIPQSLMLLGLAALLVQLVAFIWERVRHVP